MESNTYKTIHLLLNTPNITIREMIATENLTECQARYRITKVNELLNWLTFLDINEIKQIILKHNENKAQRYAQKILAYEVVKDIHSKEIACQCKNISDILFSKDKKISSLTLDDISLLKGFLPLYKYNGEPFIDFLKNNNIVSSNREAREFISKKTFIIDDFIVDDENTKIEFNNFSKKYAILKKGKKEFFIIQKQ